MHCQIAHGMVAAGKNSHVVREAAIVANDYSIIRKHPVNPS